MLGGLPLDLPLLKEGFISRRSELIEVKLLRSC